MKIKEYFLIIYLSCGVSGCVNNIQENGTTIYSWRDSQDSNVHTDYSETLDIGPDSRKASLQVKWTTETDEAGCLKIASIQIARKEESGMLNISNIRHIEMPDCVMKWDSDDGIKFTQALIRLNYKATIKFKEYTFSGVVATIQGNGGFIDHSKIQQ